MKGNFQKNVISLKLQNYSERKFEVERGSVITTFKRDLSPQFLDLFSNDVKSKPATRRDTAMKAFEHAEDFGAPIFGYADAVVLNVDEEAGRVVEGLDADKAVRLFYIRVIDRVDDEIVEDLGESRRLCGQSSAMKEGALESHRVLLSRVFEFVENRLSIILEVKRRKRVFRSLDLRKGEYVIDEFHKP